MSDYAYNWLLEKRNVLTKEIYDSGKIIVGALISPDSDFPISDDQYKMITAGHTNTIRNFRLIEILCRRSILSVQCFERVLRENYHEHVADQIKECK